MTVPAAMATAARPPRERTVEAPGRNLGLDLVRVTEAAALAAGRWMGRSQKDACDAAAVRAMRLILADVVLRGRSGTRRTLHAQHRLDKLMAISPVEY